MNRRLKERLELYGFHSKLVEDMLASLSDDQLHLSIGKGMGTLGKQFRHIGNIRSCYIGALRTDVMDFRTQSTNHEIEENKKKLLAYLKSSDRKIVSLLSDLTEAELTNKTIDWRGTHQAYGFVSTEKHLSALIEHELLHEGELVVYFRLLGLNFPASWGVWGFR